jgi:ankyrin repeat protein
MSTTPPDSKEPSKEFDKDSGINLHQAAGQGNIDACLRLLKNGADPDISTTGCPPLHNAIYWEKYQCAKILLEHGANPNLKDEKGYTPLHQLAYPGIKRRPAIRVANPDDKKLEEMCKTLLSYGANISAKANNGETILDIAEKYGKEAVATVIKTEIKKRIKTKFDGKIQEIDI